MSTLKTHNLQSPDAGSVNIALAPNAGMVVTGISTFTGDIDVDGHTNLDNVSIAGIVTVTNTGDNLLLLNSTSGPAKIKFYENGSNRFNIETLNGSGGLMFYDVPSGTERARIDASGRVLIGQTSSINGIFGSPPPRFSVSTNQASPAIFATYSSNSYASRIDLLKSRNATVGSHTVVQDGDGLGEIYFGGSDGDQFHGGALIQAVVESGVGNDDMPANLRFYTNGGATTVTERLRITSSGNLKMPDAAQIQLGNDDQSSTGDLRLYHNGSNSAVQNYQGALYISNKETNSSDLHLQGKSSIQMHCPSDGTVPLHILNTGEVRISPKTGGTTSTQFSFNNISNTPFISIKSNNVSEAAELRVEESSGGANIVFKNKNLNSALHTHFQIGHSGGIYTAEDGNVKSYPIIMSMYTQHDAHEGQLNYHSLMGPSAGIGGWVFLGHDYGPNPYPVRTFKIAVPEGGNSAIGTRVYQVWHNGDANYDYGGLWEVRINQWNNSSRFESVSIRCINGKRDDMKVIAYNNTNGIMLRPSTIWGSVYIRLAGWDENQVKRGSSYCAVQNNGALAIYNSSGTDDGTPPTSGSPFTLLPYPEGTGGRDIENNNSFNG